MGEVLRGRGGRCDGGEDDDEGEHAERADGTAEVEEEDVVAGTGKYGMCA